MRAAHIPEEKRITLLDSRGTAWGEMEYSVKGKVLSINHTGISPEKRGEGLGEQLMCEVVDYAQKNGLLIRPICPFALHFFERNSEYCSLLE